MTISDADYQHFYGDQGKWRNTLHPERQGLEPTVSTIVRHHEEPAAVVGSHYSFHICHVRGFHGKGFMPTLTFNVNASNSGNGNVFYGTDQTAYDNAVANGRTMLVDADKRIDDAIAEQNRLLEEYSKTHPNSR